MSTFGDIKTGYERLKGAKNYGLIYTCNCGWLDLGHLNPDSNNSIIGAANLWSQVSIVARPRVWKKWMVCAIGLKEISRCLAVVLDSAAVKTRPGHGAYCSTKSQRLRNGSLLRRISP